MFLQKAFADVPLVNPLESAIGVDATFGDIFNYIINILVIIGWGLVFIMLSVGFIKYVMSQGEKTQVEGAQKLLTYAVIGGVGLLLIAVLKGAIYGALGIDAGTI
jgi:hypothetical protein